MWVMYKKCGHLNAKMRVVGGYAKYTIALYIIPIMSFFHPCKSSFKFLLKVNYLLKWDIDMCLFVFVENTGIM